VQGHTRFGAPLAHVGQGEDALAVAEVTLFHAALQAAPGLQAALGLLGERRVR